MNFLPPPCAPYITEKGTTNQAPTLSSVPTDDLISGGLSANGLKSERSSNFPLQTQMLPTTSLFQVWNLICSTRRDKHHIDSAMTSTRAEPSLYSCEHFFVLFLFEGLLTRSNPMKIVPSSCLGRPHTYAFFRFDPTRSVVQVLTTLLKIYGAQFLIFNSK